MALLDQKVIDNWAEALAALAVEQKKEHAFMEQANVLVDLLKDQEDFIDLMCVIQSEKTGSFDKSKIIDTVFAKQGFDPFIVNAMKILADASAFHYARDIFKKTRRFLTARTGVEYGVAWSTEPLNADDMSRLQDKISAILGHSTRLVNKIDKTLIGGVEVVIENRIFDGSIKGRLDHMRYQIIENKNNNSEREVE